MYDESSVAFIGMFTALFPFISILSILIIAATWKLYLKAGQPGWAAIIPIYTNIIALKIGKKPEWWVLLMLIPYVGFIWWIWSINRFVKAYGKDTGWAVGCLLLPFIFYPIMAWSKNIHYIGNGDVLNSPHDPTALDSFDSFVK